MKGIFDNLISRHEALERRFNNLAKANRRFQLLLIGLIGWSVVPMLLGLTSANEPGVVRARRFELVDDSGTLLATLLPTEAGTVLAMYDRNGKPRLRFDASNVSGIWIKDDSGSDRIALAGFANGPCLLFRNSAGVDEAELGLYLWGPGLRLNDHDGLNRLDVNVSVKSPSTLQQEPKLQLRDKKGSIRAMFGTFDDGPQLVMRSAEGADRVALGVDFLGPKLSLNDSSGHARLTLAMFPGMQKDSEAGSVLRLTDGGGADRVILRTTYTESRLLIKDAQGATTHSFPP